MASNEAEELRKQEAYLALGDFIYDQNPYASFSQITRMPDFEGDPAAPVSAPQGASAYAPNVDRRIRVDGPKRDDRPAPPPAAAAKVGSQASGSAPKQEEVEEEHVLLPAQGVNRHLCWHFGNEEYNINKAMLIPYDYLDQNGEAKLGYLLVGYQGSNGP